MTLVVYVPDCGYDEYYDLLAAFVDKVQRVTSREPFLIERASEAARPARVRPRDHDGASSATLPASRTQRRCRLSAARRASGAPSRRLAVSRPRECSLTCPLRLSRAGAHAVHQGCRRLRKGGHRREGGRPRPHRPPHRAVHRIGGRVRGTDRRSPLTNPGEETPKLSLRPRSSARSCASRANRAKRAKSKSSAKNVFSFRRAPSSVDRVARRPLTSPRPSLVHTRRPFPFPSLRRPS